MKKNILSIFALLSMITISGCGNDTSSTVETSSTTSSQKTSSVTSSSEDDANKVEYTVQILLPNGSNAGADLDVQWCGGPKNQCFTSKTNASGLATIKLENYDYDVHLLKYPETYTCELGYVATTTNRNLTIQFLELNSYLSGEGTKSSPNMIGVGAYNVTVPTGGEIIYFGFTATETGTYSIESLSSSALVNPNIGYYGNDLTNIPDTVVDNILDDDNGYDNNFKLSIEAEANTTYIFGITATGFSRSKTFAFNIKKI